MKRFVISTEGEAEVEESSLIVQRHSLTRGARAIGPAKAVDATRSRFPWIVIALGLLLAGCHTDMWQQPKLAPLDESTFYSDGQSSRPLPPGTIARGHLRTDDAFFTGRVNGKYVDAFPIKVTKDVLLRGQERFNIYCTPCHGRLGDGNGMISKRGFALRRPPASYHTDRLRAMPVGHFFDVMTNGYGAMFSYAARVEPQDRWAIAAYIRVLQLSQHASASDVDSADLQKLQDNKQGAPAQK